MFAAEADGGDGARVFHQTGNGRSRSAAAPVANLPLSHTHEGGGDQQTEAGARSPDLYRLAPSWTFDPYLLKGFISPASASEPSRRPAESSLRRSSSARWIDPQGLTRLRHGGRTQKVPHVDFQEPPRGGRAGICVRNCGKHPRPRLDSCLGIAAVKVLSW